MNFLSSLFQTPPVAREFADIKSTCRLVETIYKEVLEFGDSGEICCKLVESTSYPALHAALEELTGGGKLDQVKILEDTCKNKKESQEYKHTKKFIEQRLNESRANPSTPAESSTLTSVLSEAGPSS